MANETSNDIGNTSAGGKAGNVPAHERIDRTTAKLKEGTSHVVGGAREKFDHAAEQVESGMHRAADASARGAHRATDKAYELRDRGAELASGARDRAETTLGSVREFVREKPVQSVGIALAAGWLFGRLTKPRH